MGTINTSTQAVLAYAPKNMGEPNLTVNTISLQNPVPGPNEVLVKTLASGICHSDVHVAGIPAGYLGTYPKVLGHEGSGRVLTVGSNVKTVAVGDPVLLSYTYCNECDLCKNDHPAYCERFNEENAFCTEQRWNVTNTEETVGGKFFGQSSWAGLTMVDSKSVVNVKTLVRNDDELKLFSPLGCGLMTGSGAVTNRAKVGPKDVVIVTGLGAVGLGAVMAAKLSGCQGIIAVDRVKSRLDLAKELGATAILDTSELSAEKESDFSEEAQALANGHKITYAFETTAVISVINSAFKSLGKRGMLIQIGVPPPGLPPWPLNMADLFGGCKRIEMNFLGEVFAQDHVPRMIQWYREGKFPFEKMVKYYPLKDVNQAVQDMHDEVIKPILVHDTQ